MGRMGRSASVECNGRIGLMWWRVVVGCAEGGAAAPLIGRRVASMGIRDDEKEVQS